MFKHEIAMAEQQDGRHWKINGKITRNATGDAVLNINASDSAGAPLSGLTATARLSHPADSRRDQDISLNRIGAGEFRGEVLAQRGQWELLLDLYRGDERVFRSRSRVTLN
jgi:nitrogen fixation protein FixH